MVSTCRSSASAVVILCVLAAHLAAQHAIEIHNFAEVSKDIYRGAEPTPTALKELAAMGIKVDLDLREKGAATTVESKAAKQAGLRYINIPLSAFSAPSQDDMRKILSILLYSNTGPVFVHCRRGKDRTGTAIACYRIQHDGWSNEAAAAEARKFGMSYAERGMRAFILHFKPVTLPAITTAGQ
jgi:protein tyrosine/serine phosphatase